MKTDVLVYRGWGDNGLGVYGNVLGTDYTYEISQIDPDNFGYGNSFSKAGNGFVFRGYNTSGFDDTLVYADGSSSGTIVIVNDVNGNPVVEPSSFSPFGTESVFLASNASVSATTPPRVLMATNGNGAPEVLLPFRVEEYQIIGNSLYAVAYNGGDLYKVNADYSYELINDRSVSGIATNYLFEFNGEFYFRGRDAGVNDFYSVDPVTGDSTALNIAVNGGGDSIYFSQSAVGDSQFFYWYNGTPNTGFELYVSDGTPAGTNLVEDINPGNNSSSVSAWNTIIGDKLFFIADDGGIDGAELWVSDGTAAGTFALSGTGTNVGTLSALSTNGGTFRLLAVGNDLYFAANGTQGTELYITDGTVVGTQLVLDIRPGPNASRPDNFYTDGTYLYFTIESGNDEEAVWISDGTAAGTYALSDPHSGNGNLEPDMLSIININVDNIPVRNIDGTAMADILTGSVLHETINGLAGADTLIGGNGNDVLDGGTGNDSLDGGIGTDTASYAFATATVVVNLAAGTATGGAGNDTLTSIENATGGAGNDSLTGTNNSNLLVGNAGEDRLYGRGGDDQLNGDAGNDLLKGGAGLDTLNGDAGSDVLFGGDGNDILYGGSEVDYLYGNNDDDWLYGDEGNDRLNGGAGNDTIIGGTGDDRLKGKAGDDTLYGGDGSDQLYADEGLDSLYGENGNDWLYGGKDNDILFGGAGIDRLRGNLGNDELSGGAGNDNLYGGGQSDILNGGAGNDFLYGENGADTLSGGVGNDRLYGSVDGAVDVFVYEAGFGDDRVREFEDGFDLIDLSSYGFADTITAMTFASQTGWGAVKFDLSGAVGGQVGDVLYIESMVLNTSFTDADIIV